MTDMQQVKVQRAVVQIGALRVDGFMLPDGSYRMSQTQSAECIGDDPVYARNFLRSKDGKALLDEGYTPETFEVDSTNQLKGQTRIQGWPLEVVFAYWTYRCFKGVKQAYKLISALGLETLERRFDAAFGITRTMQEWDDFLAERQQLQQAIALVLESEAMNDIDMQNYDRLKQLVNRSIDTELKQAAVELGILQPEAP